jgi:hypothetical protein
MWSTSAIWRRASTTRWLASILGLAATGCALSDGQPWGEAEVTLSARFAPPAERLTGSGRLKTAASFEIDLDSIVAQFDSVTLRMAAAGSSATFDPADPPEGYSLCHNGHCHAADGSLVAYEDILLEGSSGGYFVTRAASAEPLLLSTQPASVELGACSNNCVLERGEVATAEVTLAAVELHGRVFDGTAGGRVPAAGLEFIMTFAPEGSIVTPTFAAVANGRRVGVRVALNLRVSPKLFDDVEWTYPDGAGEPVDFSKDAGAAVAEKLIDDSELVAAVSRFH